MAARRLAIVTGANRGIGLEVVRQLAERDYTVVLGSRDLANGQAAAGRIGGGEHVLVRRLDVTDQPSIDGLRDEIAHAFGAVHALVNNAGAHYERERVANSDVDAAHDSFDTNFFGAWRMCRAFVPLLRQTGHGRIVNVSSEAGSVGEINRQAPPAYAISKAALNLLTRLLAAELEPDGILVNAVSPGWVATDMGGPGGRPAAEGAASVVWAVELADGGPTGGFFRDGKPVPW
ncbi:MAG TPA: SDR family oxidoreductase [Candidatus Dormibacteraeota bacterium]|nr:SDR family oxidoreductase [Candidatus Dormibacteraeota bacterium]